MPANGKKNLIPGAAAKRVSQCTLDGIVLQKFNSITEASRVTGVCGSSISCVANGKPMFNTAGGFKWEHC